MASQLTRNSLHVVPTRRSANGPSRRERERERERESRISLALQQAAIRFTTRADENIPGRLVRAIRAASKSRHQRFSPRSCTAISATEELRPPWTLFSGVIGLSGEARLSDFRALLPDVRASGVVKFFFCRLMVRGN